VAFLDSREDPVFIDRAELSQPDIDPLMRAAPASLVSFLAARPRNFVQVNFFQFMLNNGIVLRYCTYPRQITIPGLPPPGGRSAFTVAVADTQTFNYGGAFGVLHQDVTLATGGANVLVMAIITTPGAADGHIPFSVSDLSDTVAFSARANEAETPGNLLLKTYVVENNTAASNLPTSIPMRIDLGGEIVGRISIIAYGVTLTGTAGNLLPDANSSLPASGFAAETLLNSLGDISTDTNYAMLFSFSAEPDAGPGSKSNVLGGWAPATGVINEGGPGVDPGTPTQLNGTYMALEGTALSGATVQPWANPQIGGVLSENALVIDALANTLAPAGGAATTWIGYDVQITGGSGGKSAEFDTPAWSCKLGGTADQMEINISYFPAPILASDQAPQSVIGSTPWPVAIRQGFLDGAAFTMFTAFWASPADLLAQMCPIGYGDFDQFGNPSNGLLSMFSGFVSAVSSVDRQTAKLTIRDGRSRLDADYPRDVFQRSCIHTLYDAGCTLSAASFSATGTMGATTSTTFVYSSAQAPGYYQLGKVSYIDPATGLTVTLQIGADTGSLITVSMPFPTTPPSGTAFTIFAGCDKTKATCLNKFANLEHFLGFPYVPPPRTTI
jgi:uncharacterized protein/uncharacterized protein DUF2163